MREHFVVPSIRSREVARAKRSGIRHCEDVLQPLDFGYGLLGVHPPPTNETLLRRLRAHAAMCAFGKSADRRDRADGLNPELARTNDEQGVRSSHLFRVFFPASIVLTIEPRACANDLNQQNMEF
jgi:hypothetical protein